MFRRTLDFLAAGGFLAASLGLAGCTAYAPPGYGPPILAQPGAGPKGPAPGGPRVALLLPLTGPNANLAQTMLKAAQLALEPGAGAPPGAPPAAPPPTLDVRDTGGTPEGAAAAASQSIQAGDGMILGPLTAPETTAAAAVAAPAGVPMLAFTSDASVARPGVWTLGITAGQQVRTLVAAGQKDGRGRYAAALPATPFGNALADALVQTIGQTGGAPPDIRRYSGTQDMTSALRDLSDYANRRGAISGNPAAADQPGPPVAPAAPADAVPPPPFDALLVAETGQGAQALAADLAFDDIRAPQVRVMGPGLWANEAARLGGLAGAWYADPDPAAAAGFNQAYGSRFGSTPPRLADLAYDAASLARVLAEGGGFALPALTRPEGFAGTLGLLALRPDGQVRRGLAVFEINAGGGSHIVAPAPQVLPPPGA